MMNIVTSEAQDAADMERLARGGDAALNDLMSRHGERLFHYLVRLLQNESEAADLAQEAFARVYLNRDRFKSGSKFSTWLFAIATNLARDRLRWLARHPQVSLEASEAHESGLKNVLPCKDPTPTEQLEQEERTAAVRRAVTALPEDLRVPLILSEYEEQSHAEIAAVLDCSAKAVEMRIYRARRQLRVSLSEFLVEEKFS
jgi:RNA polymerase sigma-70 factor, ECF subfamily